MSISRYRELALLTLLLSAAFMPLSCSRQEEAAPQEILLTRAMDDIDAGRPAEALKKLETVLKERPNDFNALQVKSMALSTQGRYEEAIEVLEQLSARQPDNLDIQFHLGTLYFNQQKWEKAAAYLEKATAEPKREVRAREMLWRCYQNLGLTEWKKKAADELEKLLTMRPNDPVLLTLMGDHLASRRRYRDAIEKYEAALKVEKVGKKDPGLATVHERIATCWGALGQYHEALRTLTAALQRIPQDPGLKLRLVEVYLQLGKASEALSQLDRFETMHGKSKESELLRNAAKNLLSPQRTQR